MLNYYNIKIKSKQIKNKFFELWASGAFHIMIGSFLNKFISMFGSIIIVRLITKAEYGLLSYIENLYSYAYVIAGFGLSNAILRYVVLAKSKEKKYEYFSFSLKKGFIINIILLIIINIINFVYPHKSDFAIARSYIYILSLVLPMQHIIEDVLYMERANFSNKRFAYLSLLSSVILIIGRIFGALVSGLFGIVFIQVIDYIILAICYYFICNRRYKPEKEISKLSIKEKKEVLLYSIQYMITNGLWTIFMLNDTFMLGNLTQSASILADYRVAYVLPAAISIFSTAIGTYISPYFVKNETNQTWIKKNFFLVFFITAGVVGFIILGIILFGKYIIFIIYGKKYFNIITLMNHLLVASFFNCGIRFTCANLLAAMGQIKYNMIISMLGMILQVILNFILIPIYGAYGAAYTSIIVYFFMGFMLFLVFSKKYHLFK